MRQVPRYAGRPVKHLLIGNGRLARHLAYYFTQLDLPFEAWRKPRELSRDLFSRGDFTHVWFLVSDSAIEAVARRFREGVKEFSGIEVTKEGDQTLLLHVSGALVTDLARGAHPLMTFGTALYETEAYKRIPFVIEEAFDGLAPEMVLGGLPNIAVTLAPERRPLYHALVSSAGNFPAMLWAEIFSKFEEKIELPRNLLAPFLFQTLANVLREGDAALTGPLVRGDHATIAKHKRVLQGSKLGPLYAAFERFFTHVPAPGGHDVQ